MPRRNFRQAKREREATREKKKAEKLQRKLDRTTPSDQENTPTDPGSPDLQSPESPG